MYGEPMKLQVGKIFMNRTRKYLFPIIKEYGSDFTSKINALFKVGVGIGDMIVDQCGIHHEHHLFILIDTLHNTPLFISLLDDIRRHPAYEDDYVYGNVNNSRFHMIVISIPEKYLSSFNNFKQSRFSQMYNREDLKKLFNFESSTIDAKSREIISVLIKDHNYRFDFAKIIQKEFEVSEFTPEDIPEENELDMQILDREEKFNFQLIKPKEDETSNSS